MIFDRNENKEVIALLGAGSMGTEIVRRIAAGRTVFSATLVKQILKKRRRIFGTAVMRWKQ